MTVDQIVKHFNMQAHPEGGYYLETYKSDLNVESSDFDSVRKASTGIYFLMEKDKFSAFHKIKSDEMWHFYKGSPLEVVEITESGELIQTTIGNDILNGQQLQYVVKKNRWFASFCKDPEGYSLVGCTVAPGFDFKDFDLANRNDLINKFPDLSEVITKLTRL